ncbi:inter-alpha-trypsin inhibitor heavy chain H3-like isoform X8 [Entelurus aequoreus]|uniref:inter-alpha-trypsin inhibitor heavy chain H3-like isoform X8 n=1 Tax=Entelurus aequoreus TaxID=161455 RepID=UPI002B1E10C6|nr:inter-alpha-trypsin inhibitor heavy chain H3-like isoform X8 [Entelurus aequoreus]
MERTVVRVSIFGLLLAFGGAQPNKDDWEIYSFHINSTVTTRYATTVITSRVVNRKDESTEVEFHVRIPKNAFISKFRMFMDDQVYDGEVKAKEAAQQQYTQAVSRGESAGIVSSVGRTLEEFKTSVTVAPLKKVTFELTYEELFRRRLGKYELQIFARPMQPVKDFKVDVYIHEKAGINYMDIKGGLSTNALANAITKTLADKQAWVYFYPTVDQQKTCDSCGEQGLNGDLVIVYDVNRHKSLGDIKRSKGYFVHHFAPSSLLRIPKNVVFVIDQSGSMHGRKMEQTRMALLHILSDLAEEDYFGLITFDSNLFYWKRELVQANADNVKSAKTFASNIKDRGSTNINTALLEGSRMLNEQPRQGSASILILLTDGDPTSGVTNLEQIQSNVRAAIQDKFPLYCLGFGFDVNFAFLERMSLQNNGVARRIYEDSDADLQLKGFYDEVANPLLTNVTMSYSSSANLTQTKFSQYYNGSEIVVAGQITDNDVETFVPQVVAISRNASIVFSDANGTTESTDDSNLQRVWAYLTVKQLLDKELQLSGVEKEKVKSEALRLSLKYGFVTPLTSMVVTKPSEETTEVLHKPSEDTPPLPRGTSLVMRPGILSKGQSRMTSRGGHFFPQAGAFPGFGGSASAHPGLKVKQQAGAIPGFGGNYPNLHLPAHPGFKGDPGSRGLPGSSGPPILQDLAIDYDYDSPPIAPTTLSVAPGVRFLLQAENQSLPLCFDIAGRTILRLLHLPNAGVSVNGELDEDQGFIKIIVHFDTDNFVAVELGAVTVKYEQKLTRYTGDTALVAGSVAVSIRHMEVDITAGQTRLLILVHGKNGKDFLWPALRQQPSDDAVGILAQKAVVYEEVHQGPYTKLKMKDQEISVSRSSAVDFGMNLPATLACWLMSPESALRAPLSDFTLKVL